MKKTIVFATTLCCAMLLTARHAPAQASPGLEETLAFITATLSEQGAIPLKTKNSPARMLDQQVVARGECAWQYRFRMETLENMLGDGSVAVDLPLRKLNVKTVAQRAKSEGLTVYEVTIDKPAAEKTSDAEAPWTIGTLKDRDAAERVTKAYVHALVLCSKDSLF